MTDAKLGNMSTASFRAQAQGVSKDQYYIPGTAASCWSLTPILHLGTELTAELNATGQCN